MRGFIIKPITEVKFASQKHIVLLSENNLLKEAIENGCTSVNSSSNNLTLIRQPTLEDPIREDYDHLSFFPKVDLLISDAINAIFPSYKIKNIINIGGNNTISQIELDDEIKSELTQLDSYTKQNQGIKRSLRSFKNRKWDNFLAKDEIKLLKPLKLSNLLDLIENTISCVDIFCAINKNLVYNELLWTLSSPEKIIKFTEKENEIFKSLLISEGFNITKEMLMKNIWRYHADTESLTLDTHLYKLKNKLPKGLLEIKNNICYLHITHLI